MPSNSIPVAPSNGIKMLVDGTGLLLLSGVAFIVVTFVFGVNYFLGSVAGAATAIWGYTKVAAGNGFFDLSFAAFRSSWRLTAFLSLGIPALAMLLAWQLMPSGAFSLGWNWTADELTTAIGFVTVAAIFATTVEELFFRGLLLRFLSQHIGLLPAIASQSLLFMLMHALGTTGVGGYRWLHLLLMGYITALLFLKTRSLLAAIVVHAVWNLSSLILIAMLPAETATLGADSHSWERAKISMTFFSTIAWATAGILISVIYFRQNSFTDLLRRRTLFSSEG